jgi:hypothetical protein
MPVVGTSIAVADKSPSISDSGVLILTLALKVIKQFFGRDFDRTA